MVLDLETGIVRDYFSNYGLLGTMPCYHDNITEMVWVYCNDLLNLVRDELNDLQIISNFSNLRQQ